MTPQKPFLTVLDASGRFLANVTPGCPEFTFRHGKCARPVYDSFTLTFRKCRKCFPCKVAKAKMWASRAHREASAAPRTWFVTLTFASVPDDPVAAVQRYLKRLRKAHPGKPFRYLCVLEKGSLRGREHFHLLIHCHRTLRRRDIEAPWSEGFSKAKLFRPEHAWYVCKYVTKGSDSRVQSSAHYGDGEFVCDWDVAHIPLTGGRKNPLHKIPF